MKSANDFNESGIALEYWAWEAWNATKCLIHLIIQFSLTQLVACQAFLCGPLRILSGPLRFPVWLFGSLNSRKMIKHVHFGTNLDKDDTRRCLSSLAHKRYPYRCIFWNLVRVKFGTPKCDLGQNRLSMTDLIAS